MNFKVHYCQFPLSISKQMLKSMKLLPIILFAVCLQVSARGYPQITLSETNTPLQKVFQKIHQQVGYDFVSTYETIQQAGSVTVNVQNVSLQKALEACLKGKPLTYVIIGKTVVVRAKEKTDYKLSSTIGSVTLPPSPIEIQGRVVNRMGEPLQNVSVLIAGTKIGTTTNIDGHFTLTSDNKIEILEISSVGYQTKRVVVGGQTEINVTLELNISGLSDVVVVGYGTQKKIDLTGSIVSISDKQLKTSTNVSLSDALAGKLPGLSVVEQSGQPGDYSSVISIRGWGSPLVIVDGVKRSDYAEIDPNEIENISVLKDASASIYGVKASNGVILITTKKGKEGKPQISYSNTYGLQAITSYPRPMNAAEYTQAYGWAQQNSGVPITYSAQEIADYKSGKLPSTNWWDLIMNNTATQDQQNLTVSGGSEKIKYFNSLGYMSQNGLFKSGDLNYNRFNFRSDVSAQITKNFDAQLNISGISDVNNAPSGTVWNMFKSLWGQNNIYPLYANNNPDYLQNMPDGNENPYALTNTSIVGYNNTYNKTFDGGVTLNYKIPFIEGLKAKFFYDYYFNDNYNKVLNKSYTLYTYDALGQNYTPSYNNQPTNMSNTYTESTRSTMDASLNYDKTLGMEHHLQAMLLYENVSSNSNFFSGLIDFSNPMIYQLSGGDNGQKVTGYNEVGKINNQAIVGRLNYNYASKYLFEFNFREDGSSLFPKGKQWGFFPGMSLGWRLSQENFIKDNLPFISDLKVRGSWGKMGNDEAANYQYVQGYNYPTYVYYFNGVMENGLSSTGMANPNITWYSSTISNIGIDGNLWNQKLNFTIDVFKRKMTGLLGTLALSMPESVGAALPQQNINSQLSHGIEISVGTTRHINKVQFGVNAHFAYSHMEWLHYEQAEAGNLYLNWLNNADNRSGNIIWGYNVIGQFKSQAQINTAPIIDGNGNKYIKPGDLIYEDVNHDGVINSLDMVPIAKGDMNSQQGPEITYGINLTFEWKGFDASVLLQGTGNFNVDLQNDELLSHPFLWGRNGLTQYLDVWHQTDPTNPNSSWIPGTYAPSRVSGFDPNQLPSSYWVKNAAYLRLKNVRLGYTLTSGFIKKTGLQQVKVFTNAFNLFTWSHIPYMDPEHPQTSAGYLYPITRNFNLGFNVTF